MSSFKEWVVISGASTGIGRAAAVMLAQRAGPGGSSSRGVLAGYRKDSDAESIRQEAAKLGLADRLVPIRLDVTSQADIDACKAKVGELTRAGGALSALVNNAGFLVFGPVETLPLSEWRRQFDTNFFGAIALTQALLPFLLASKGRIVNISSIGGKVSQPLIGSYTASKFAMEAMTDSLRMELSRTGVKVVLIEPGAIKTPIWGKGLSEEDRAIAALPAETRARYEPMLRRLGVAAKKMADGAIPAEKAAVQIVRAIDAGRPARRKLVGMDAHVLAALKWLLPTAWMDAFVITAFGLHK